MTRTATGGWPENIFHQGRAGIVSGPRCAWKAECHAFRRYEEIAPLVHGLVGSTFQSPIWLSTWFEVFAADGAIEPFLIVFRDDDAAIAMAIPLIRRRDGALHVIEFADLSVSDYDMPLLRADKTVAQPASEDLYPVLIDALPPADLLRFLRLAPTINGHSNPLFGHGWAVENPISGWVLPMLDDWIETRRSFSASQREVLDRKRRKLEQMPGVSIRVIDDLQDGVAALEALTQMQAKRNRELGQAFHLDQPKYRLFYEQILRRGLDRDDVLLCGIHQDGEGWIALNFGVRSGDEIVYLRLGNQFGDWAKLSPGVLLTEFMMQQAHARGVRIFDFAMGNYEYKKRLGATRVQLQDLVLPLSTRGIAHAAAWHLRRRLSQLGWLRRLLGRKPI